MLYYVKAELRQLPPTSREQWMGRSFVTACSTAPKSRCCSRSGGHSPGDMDYLTFLRESDRAR